MRNNTRAIIKKQNQMNSVLPPIKSEIQSDFEELINDISQEVIKSSVNQTLGENILKLNNETIKVEKVRSQLNTDSHKISEAIRSIEKATQTLNDVEINQKINEIKRDVNSLFETDELIKKSKKIQQIHQTLELLKYNVLLMKEMDDRDSEILLEIVDRQYAFDKRMTSMFYAFIFIIILLLFILVKL